MRRPLALTVPAFALAAACASQPPADRVAVTPETPAGSAAVTSHPPSARRARDRSAPDKAHGAITVEQDHRVASIVNHVATIHRRPFVLTVRIRDARLDSGVLLNASFVSSLFDVAASGAPLPTGDGDPFGEGSAMAEASPPEPTLYLADDASHDWYWGGEDSRCESVIHRGDDVFCTRRIESLDDLSNSDAPEAIGSLHAKELNLVSYQREREGGGERARGYLKLVFDSN
ncbi:MAG: hypothetical protein U0414_03185 [Polyangiaceae bacterium]